MNMNRPTTTVFKQKAFFDERVRATGMQSIFHAESVKLYLRKMQARILRVATCEVNIVILYWLFVHVVMATLHFGFWSFLP